MGSTEPQRSRLLVSLLAAAVAAAAVVPGPTEAKLLYPPDKTLLSGDGAIEVLAFRPPGKPGTLAVAQRQGSKEHPAGEGAVRVKVVLRPGSSTLELDGETVTVFLGGDGAGQPPAGFEAADEHAVGIGCGDCHRLEGGKAPLLEAGAKLCLRCHDDVTKGAGEAPVLHPPAAEGDCSACHRTHGAAIRKLSPAGRRALCRDCHEDVSRNAAGTPWKTPHAPVAKGDCTACHDPHAAPHRFLLSRYGNQVCLGCHQTTHKNHRVAGPTSSSKQATIPEGFPVSRNGELACGGCHLPHGSDFKRLWIRPAEVLCARCHKSL